MKLFLGTLLTLGLIAAAAPRELAGQDKGGQDKGTPTKPAQGGKDQGGKAVPANASALEAKMREFGTPGPAHKVLDARVGRWNLDVKMFEPGSTEANESKGTSEIKSILDGRFIQETATGEFMGQPFNGMGTCGYDNLKQKYVSTWIDNMGTGVMYAEGTYDAGAKTFTFAGECPDLMAGKYTKNRTVQKVVDADHLTMQTYKPGPDGKDALVFQIDYTRAK